MIIFTWIAISSFSLMLKVCSILFFRFSLIYHHPGVLPDKVFVNCSLHILLKYIFLQSCSFIRDIYQVLFVGKKQYFIKFAFGKISLFRWYSYDWIPDIDSMLVIQIFYWPKSIKSSIHISIVCRFDILNVCFWVSYIFIS